MNNIFKHFEGTVEMFKKFLKHSKNQIKPTTIRPNENNRFPYMFYFILSTYLFQVVSKLLVIQPSMPYWPAPQPPTKAMA